MRVWMLFAVMFLLCSCNESINGAEGNEVLGPVEMELENFAHIKTSGTYTFVATPSNGSGGETVPICREYYIGKYAVTNEEWALFVEETKGKAPKYWTNGECPDERRRHPVLWVSFDEAVHYCEWLSSKSQEWTFRLPTQAEWEYAAVGLSGTHFPWGNATEVTFSSGVLSSKMNYNAVVATEVLKEPNREATYIHEKSVRKGESDRISEIISVSQTGGVSGWVNHADYLGFIYTDIFEEINSVGGYTCEVDAYPDGVTWSGCYNMCGNCWEWTSSVEIAQNGAEKGMSVNVIRGGSWYANASSCRASFRGEGRKPSSAYNTVGLRIVAERKTSGL